MKEVEIIKKYLKFNELLKVRIRILDQLEKQQLPNDELHTLLEILIDQVLIPFQDLDAIEQLKLLLQNNQQLLHTLHKKTRNLQFTNEIKTIKAFNLQNIQKIKTTFLNLEPEKRHIQTSLKTVQIDIAKQTIYAPYYATLKFNSLIEINQRLASIQNETELRPYLDDIEDIFIDKMQTDESSIFSLFFDEIIFDLDLIIKRFATETIDPLTFAMFQAYSHNLIPCDWKGNYPEGQILAVQNENY